MTQPRTYPHRGDVLRVFSWALHHATPEERAAFIGDAVERLSAVVRKDIREKHEQD